MMSRMTLDLTPRLVAHLASIEKLVGEKGRADDLICEALHFYEDILKRALEGKKIRLSFAAENGEGEHSVPSTLDERMELASRVGLLPKS